MRQPCEQVCERALAVERTRLYPQYSGVIRVQLLQQRVVRQQDGGEDVKHLLAHVVLRTPEPTTRREESLLDGCNLLLRLRVERRQVGEQDALRRASPTDDFGDLAAPGTHVEHVVEGFARGTHVPSTVVKDPAIGQLH